jgi:hypothetical protein
MRTASRASRAVWASRGIGAALLAEEINPPPGEAPLRWLFLTNLPVENAAQALEKLSWSPCRWQAEVYSKIRKSGCKIEE